MARAPNPVPKGGRKPDTALADNVGLDPNLTTGRAAQAGGKRKSEDFPMPTPEYRPKAQTRADPECRRPPSQTHQPEPAPEILYIREQCVNYYITRENKMVSYKPVRIRPFSSFFHSPPILF